MKKRKTIPDQPVLRGIKMTATSSDKRVCDNGSAKHVFGMLKVPKGTVIKCGGLVESNCSDTENFQLKGKQ